MIQFLIKWVLQAAVVMLIISMFCFSIQDSLGDPTREMAAMSMSDAERDSLRERMGLNDSLLVQYGRFVNARSRAISAPLTFSSNPPST
jgi:peptide/nickel transport system permease protein